MSLIRVYIVLVGSHVYVQLERFFVVEIIVLSDSPLMAVNSWLMGKIKCHVHYSEVVKFMVFK